MTDEERRLEPPNVPDYAELIEAVTTWHERVRFRDALAVLHNSDMISETSAEYEAAEEVIACITEDILCDERIAETDINNYFGRVK
jgi:hypothetical protein